MKTQGPQASGTFLQGFCTCGAGLDWATLEILFSISIL